MEDPALATDLAKEAFIAKLRRFGSRRVYYLQISLTDTTNFTEASGKLKKLQN